IVPGSSSSAWRFGGIPPARSSCTVVRGLAVLACRGLDVCPCSLPCLGGAVLAHARLPVRQRGPRAIARSRASAAYRLPVSVVSHGLASSAPACPPTGAHRPSPHQGIRMTERDVDADLVARVQKGDKRAYDLLVLKYQRKIMRMLARMVRDPAEIEDVAQEAFIKAYRALPQFRGESAFYTWLYRIAINTARNWQAARSRRPTGEN